MKHLFIPYELALLAKEKGFSATCFAFYNESSHLVESRAPKSDKTLIHAPTHQQIQDYLRDGKGIFISASPRPIYNEKYGFKLANLKHGDSEGGYSVSESTSYYGALNEAIEKALKSI